MEDSKNPYYIAEDAAIVIFDNISAPLKSKLTRDKIVELLDIVDDFYETKGLHEETSENNVPPIIEMEEQIQFIIDNSSEQGFNLSYKEVNEILEGEEIYMKQIGIIDDEE